MPPDGSMDVARWISLAMAAAFCVFALVLQPTYIVLFTIGYMVLPLAAIWYGDELGTYSSGHWYVNMPTPGILVKFVGWVLLLLTPLATYAFKLRLEMGI